LFHDSSHIATSLDAQWGQSGSKVILTSVSNPRNLWRRQTLEKFVTPVEVTSA
jgi:hypothetical protein